MRIVTHGFAAFATVAMMLIGANVSAQDVAPATTAALDKWQFSLFDPVPESSLREMDTDRPNKTNTPHTIDSGHLQIETGLVDYLYDRERHEGVNSRSDSWNLGQFNFRLGVLNNLEVNLVVNSYEFLNSEDYVTRTRLVQTGLGDSAIGGKLNVWGNEGGDAVWQSGLGIQPQFKVPTAREDLGNGHGEFYLGVPFTMNLPAAVHLSLQTTVSYERNSNDNGDVAGWQNAGSIDRVFLQKVDLYLEYWSHVSSERHTESQQTLDTGVIYQLTDNVTLDSGINFGLNRASVTVEWLSGVSVRF